MPGVRNEARDAGARDFHRPILRLRIHANAADLSAVADRARAGPNQRRLFSLRGINDTAPGEHGVKIVAAVAHEVARAEVIGRRCNDLRDIDGACAARLDRAVERRGFAPRDVERQHAAKHFLAEHGKSIALGKESVLK